MLFLALCDLLREIGIGTTIHPASEAVGHRSADRIRTLVLLTRVHPCSPCPRCLAPFFAAFMSMPQLDVVR